MKHTFTPPKQPREAFGCTFTKLSQQCTRCDVVRVKVKGVWHYHNAYEGLGSRLGDKCGEWPCVPHKGLS